MRNNEKCVWTFLDCIDTDKNGQANKWVLASECGESITMTKSNSIWGLYKSTLEPHQQFTTLGVKCPHCGKELEFLNPYED